MNHTGKNYGDMTLEELQRELREAFLDTDILDEPLNDELEQIREAMNRKRPVEYLYTPEESWARFWEKNEEELETILRREADPISQRDDAERLRVSAGSRMRSSRPGRVLRGVLIAAVITVLLAGAALAANFAGLWAWVPRWNAAAGRYEPAATEVSGESPIREALAELGITEPVYPAWLPEDFSITESRISKEPLVLVEQYAKGDRHLSITVTPIDGFKTAVYQKGEVFPQEYWCGQALNYVFGNGEIITAVWYTKNYVTTVSGNLTLGELRQIVSSVYPVVSTDP